MEYDVFNGDADGICALQQLRLAEPGDSLLVTGVKRDIDLLRQVQAQAGDRVTVLDISLDTNRDALRKLLAAGVKVRYFDHHFAGEIPEDTHLQVFIDPLPNTCTSLLVDRFLASKFRAWAVVGAYGDNLEAEAQQAASTMGLQQGQMDSLRRLGISINYNSYGASIEDLLIPPEALFWRLHPYADPLVFIAEDELPARLEQGYHEDMVRARQLLPEWATETHAVFILPAVPWARRVSGVWANQLAQENPGRAHALLTRLPSGGYVVSVRASLARKNGADALCRRFPTGGGRRSAGGINFLPEELVGDFIAQFQAICS